MSSPKVIAQEKDLTFSIQSITSNATGYVGLFTWGPANEIVDITTNESELVNRFGEPSNQTSLYFHAAANYLLYSVPLKVVRAVGSASLNAIADDAQTAGQTPILVNNEDEFDDLTDSSFTTQTPSFIGRYPGSLGNSIKVSAADSTDYQNWVYADEFEFTPTGGQFNLIVIDEDGSVTGTAGTVLEKYELLTKTQGDKKTDGTTAYVVEALKTQSNWVFCYDETQIIFTETASLGVYETSLVGGVDDNDPLNIDFASGYDLFSNKETVNIVRLMTSGSDAVGAIKAIDIAESRGDCVAFVAPELADVYNNLDAVVDVKEFFNTTINKNTSYGFAVDNWKMVNDKYNDKNIWIPTDSDAAGLHSRVFVTAEPWFSPAGLNRGQLKNVIKLAWNPTEPQRDTLYKDGINSIVAFPGEGTVLWGDKTMYKAPSAFNRINVRTLFIVIKVAISRAARYQLFELNDGITRSLFRNATDRYLDNVQGRRGIIDKRVVCDETNNTAQVIDSNEFVGDIYVKPARSINIIRLSFVAVGTGVDFEEIENA
ncbi:MAG: phage tail sheath subtilisin-like domain-containing protein [Nitrosopumilaceae archaeon]|nr:phage tail sheath subtilisin-like domain-containing protein [Nitrosopumilaceae archaeon]